MSKPKRPLSNGRSATGGQRFVLVPHHVLSSPAWKSLTGNAIKILFDLWQQHNGQNNGELLYSVRKAEEIGLTKDQAARAIRELEAKQFVVVTRRSTFDTKIKEGQARRFEITAEQCAGRPASKGFMKLQKAELAEWAAIEAESAKAKKEAAKAKKKARSEVLAAPDAPPSGTFIECRTSGTVVPLKRP